MIDTKSNEVHLLGLDLADVALVETSLGEKAVITPDDETASKAIRLIELINAGCGSMLAANLGGPDVFDI